MFGSRDQKIKSSFVWGEERKKERLHCIQDVMEIDLWSVIDSLFGSEVVSLLGFLFWFRLLTIRWNSSVIKVKETLRVWIHNLDSIGCLPICCVVDTSSPLKTSFIWPLMVLRWPGSHRETPGVVGMGSTLSNKSRPGTLWRCLGTTAVVKRASDPLFYNT